MTIKLSEADWETAAREYCALVGRNPDAMVPHGAEPDDNGFVHAVLMYSPYWRFVVDQLKEQRAGMLAIAAMEQTND